MRARQMLSTPIRAAAMMAALIAVTPALAAVEVNEQPAVVAVSVGDTIEFVSAPDLGTIEGAIRDITRGNPLALRRAIRFYDMRDSVSAQFGTLVWASHITPVRGEWPRTNEFASSSCAAPGHACIGIVRSYRSSLNSWRWRSTDLVQGNHTRLLGFSVTIPIA